MLIKLEEEALVTYRSGEPPSPSQEILVELSSEYGISGLEAVFTASTQTMTRSTSPDDSGDVDELSRWFKAALPEDTEVLDIIQPLTDDPLIEMAEPDFIRSLTALPDSTTDPKYADQWHLGAINAPEAWQFLANNGINPGGSRDIVTAVIDTGVDCTHPDLANNIWVNSTEFNGTPGVDDDGNGFVDDIHGVDVVSNQHSGNPDDDHGHGTHVAGIIAASANNNEGGVGVAYNTLIMPIKAAQYSGVLSTSDIAEAIYYAVDKGADIINMSFGGYVRSQIEEDALAVAFGQAVLVAAAGNDKKVNLPCSSGRDMYPAAYNWVLGVMASTQGGSRAYFSNFDCTPHDTHEYELMAPGVDILSTLPGGKYAAWDGTSMAAPVVSGIAALVRSYFFDKDVYSSRFIMGQIAAQGSNALAALTTYPEPNLTYLEHWLFDTEEQNPSNDSDGIVDAGETVDLAIVIRNHWGKADNVNVNLRAWNGISENDDPYVTMINNDVSYGAVGSFNVDDNGLIYDSDGMITGVGSPFTFTVDPDIPNDHVIPFYLTMTCKNGYAPTETLTHTSRFSMMVQKGREVPRIISENTTLTKEYYWIIPDQTLIEVGATLNIESGTQVQFWSGESTEVYNQNKQAFIQVEGTLIIQGNPDEPVDLFPGSLYFDKVVEIFPIDLALIQMEYVRIINPIIGPNYGPTEKEIYIDHSYFIQDIDPMFKWISEPGYWSTEDPRVNATIISDSIFHKLGHVEYRRLFFGDFTTLSGNLFDSSAIRFSGASKVNNNVFLKNYFFNNGNYATSSAYGVGYSTIVNDDSVGQTNNQFRNNAILNRWWDPDINHWMRFFSWQSGEDNNRDITYYLNDNYWGTTSRTLIDATIMDFNDDFNKALIVYEPILSTPPESTYPFVTCVTYTQDGVDTARVGPGELTFTVSFNRDMDTSIQPKISFGPDLPVTDYTVYSIGGGWQDARTWIGTFNINPTTGDGYQLMRIADAVAADDPWLVTGDDSGRFRFEIITSGTEAMNLQATGAEGRVDLSWAQDDFDLLAGYNLYRSLTVDGDYTRINENLIPADQKTYIDIDVAPGQPYYYKFTVVKTDMTESDFSNVAAGTPLDTIPPVISHNEISSAAVGIGLQIFADVTDNVRVESVTLNYRDIGDSVYDTAAMVHTTGNRYSVTLDGSLITAPGLEYYIEAYDGVSTTRHGHADLPHVVNVIDAPEVTGVSPLAGPASGNTSVTIIGTNFKAGASVIFGGSIAGNVTVISPNQITCKTPPHFPSLVDVTVINPDEANGTILNAYTYESEDASVSIPDLEGDNGDIIDIPISASNIEGLMGADLSIQYDSSVLHARDVRTGTLTPGFTIASNLNIPGEIVISLASATSSSGAGTLAYLEFDVIGDPGASTDLTLNSVLLNDGAIPVIIDDGTFIVRDYLSVAGHVRYYQDSTAVDNVTMNLTGVHSYSEISDAAGSYAINDVIAGDYTLTPSKTDEFDAISSYDASFILQASVSLITLSSNQLIAADVNKNGIINSMDASYVLQRSAQLINLPFPGAGKIWDFIPSTRSYTPLSTDQANQDFTAILIGDVSGNWGADKSKTILKSIEKGITSAEVSLPEIPAVSSGQKEIPLSLNLTDSFLYGADIVIGYDPDTVTPVAVTTTDLSNQFNIVSNFNIPGEIRIAMAGANPVTTSGILAIITFDINSSPNTKSPLDITSASLNEGNISTEVRDGNLYISDETGALVLGETWEARGELLTDVTLTTSNGISVLSGGDGSYWLIAVSPGTYTITASMPGYRNQVLGYTITDVNSLCRLVFKANTGLVPYAPDMSYVLACINKWKFPPEGLGLDLLKVLSVINAWKFPIE